MNLIIQWMRVNIPVNPFRSTTTTKHFQNSFKLGCSMFVFDCVILRMGMLYDNNDDNSSSSSNSDCDDQSHDFSPTKRCELFDFFHVDWPVWTHTLNCVWSDERNKINEPSKRQTEWARKRENDRKKNTSEQMDDPTKLWNGLSVFSK